MTSPCPHSLPGNQDATHARIPCSICKSSPTALSGCNYYKGTRKTDNICFNGNVDCVFRGRHHVDVSYIADASELLATSIFKANILPFSTAACTITVPESPNTLVHFHSTAVQV
jgi:hypothetical protein